MTHPAEFTHPLVEEMLLFLDDSQREFYEERAGILQFDAHLDRLHAEALALLEVVNRDGWPPARQRKAGHLI